MECQLKMNPGSCFWQVLVAFSGYCLNISLSEECFYFHSLDLRRRRMMTANSSCTEAHSIPLVPLKQTWTTTDWTALCTLSKSHQGECEHRWLARTGISVKQPLHTETRFITVYSQRLNLFLQKVCYHRSCYSAYMLKTNLPCEHSRSPPTPEDSGVCLIPGCHQDMQHNFLHFPTLCIICHHLYCFHVKQKQAIRKLSQTEIQGGAQKQHEAARIKHDEVFLCINGTNL